MVSVLPIFVGAAIVNMQNAAKLIKNGPAPAKSMLCHLHDDHNPRSRHLVALPLAIELVGA